MRGAQRSSGARVRDFCPSQSAALYLALWLAVAWTPAHAQNRGVYPLGLSTINSGIAAQPGLTYSNSFLFYARDEQVGGNGEILATGQQAVLLDMNTVLWASQERISWLGGATFSCAATIPIANNSLSSTTQGSISGGGGLGDSYFQPVILAWQTARADVRGIIGVLAPTGRFSPGAMNNVGNGYWTPVIATGQTFYPSADRRTTVSLFEMYEFHGTQTGTGIHPGETLDLDYSILQSFSLRSTDARLQAGVVGYAAWQTTAKTGPGITAAEQDQRYRVNSLGVGANLLMPSRQMTLSLKYFDEFSNRWTYQGYSLQVAVSVGF